MRLKRGSCYKNRGQKGNEATLTGTNHRHERNSSGGMVNGLLTACIKGSLHMTRPGILSSAKAAIATETEGMAALLSALDGELGKAIVNAVDLMHQAKGRIIVTGMGKSGHIARKIAATLASTGTPSSYVHPAEASHGDLGMITPQDVVIMLSNSGESVELKDILNYATRFSVPLVAITANAVSTMAKASDIVLELPRAKEACPNGLAPTTSTLLQLALGDALAMALLELKGFTANDFRSFHPGGKLGARIKHARDLMHVGDEVPLAKQGTPLPAAITIMTEKTFGCVGIVDSAGELTGLITDGDLRRHVGKNLSTLKVDDIMTRNPKTISGDLLSGEVIELINDKRITTVFVVDAAGKPEGLIHIHDLLKAGVS
jgi:arabinose-5-phosphate isomerase